MLWMLAAAGLAAWLWLLWRSAPRPVTPGGAPGADPHAAEMAEFRRQLGDWCRG